MSKFHSLSLGGVIIATLFAAGCQSRDPAAALAVDGSAPEANQKISAEELRAFCPAVQLREGTAYYRTYAKGGQDDPTKLIYQVTISDVTRACTYSDAGVTVNVAVAGRVVSGPAGASGSVTLPLRIAALRGTDVVYSQLHQHNVAAGSGTTQFVFNDPAVFVPGKADSSIKIFAGFDEGPPGKKKADSIADGEN